jgi:transcriptional regulator with XRE-family HTH domain
MIQNGSYAVIPFGSRGIFQMLTIEQLRAARGLLGWSQSKLAARAGLSLPTVKRVEADLGPRVSDEARNKLRRALEAAGVDFIDENGGGPGVRLAKRRSKKS